MTDDIKALREVGEVKLTKAQAKALAYVAENSGRLYGSRRDFPRSAGRRDVFERLRFARLISPPVANASKRWEITPAGRAALTPKDAGQ